VRHITPQNEQSFRYMERAITRLLSFYLLNLKGHTWIQEEIDVSCMPLLFKTMAIFFTNLKQMQLPSW